LQLEYVDTGPITFVEIDGTPVYVNQEGILISDDRVIQVGVSIDVDADFHVVKSESVVHVVVDNSVSPLVSMLFLMSLCYVHHFHADDDADVFLLLPTFL